VELTLISHGNLPNSTKFCVELMENCSPSLTCRENGTTLSGRWIFHVTDDDTTLAGEHVNHTLREISKSS